MTLSQGGLISDRLTLPLGLDVGNFVIKVSRFVFVVFLTENVEV